MDSEKNRTDSITKAEHGSAIVKAAESGRGFSARHSDVDSHCGVSQRGRQAFG